MVAEAYKVDLSTPEGLEQLPTIMREADHILLKHKNLENHETAVNAQICGG